MAAVLRNSIFDNQSVDKFQESIASKATRHLNKLSRISCPKQEHFVGFSSASCGRDNAGQSNYGMTNSNMERIFEQPDQEKLMIEIEKCSEAAAAADVLEVQRKMNPKQTFFRQTEVTMNIFFGGFQF